MPGLIGALLCLLLIASAARAEVPECAKAAKGNGVIVLTDQPVKISLAADSLDKSAIVAAMILIDGGAHRYCVETTLPSDPAATARQDALREEGRRQVIWLSPYLLVRSDQSTQQEVVNKTWIFKKVNGEMIPLGALGGDATSGASGRFLSLYNKAAVWRDPVAFFCMACKPRINLVIDDRDGTLAADAAATWQLNEKERLANDAYIDERIKAGLPPPGDDSGTRTLVLRALIENAVIAKYCGHDIDMNKQIDLAKAHLDQISQDELAESLRNVVPLEVPDRWGAVWHS